MNLKDFEDYYLTVKLYSDTSSFTINELYESFKAQIKEELEDEFCKMLKNTTVCPKCHKVHFEKGKCGCGLEIVL